jgi:glutathione S-transferase
MADAARTFCKRGIKRRIRVESDIVIFLADVLLAPQLDFFRETPEWPPLTANHPSLVEWLGKMNARPSMTATTWERVAAMAKAA